MHHARAFVATMGLIITLGLDASAQTTLPARAQNQPFRLTHNVVGGAAAQAGRARARRGDCAGALAAYDEALRTSIDPTVRRDRGLCHEKLGNVFPAIDDYRAYLTESPDAADAAGIRQRLFALEEKAGVGGPPPEGSNENVDSAKPTIQVKADGTVEREVDSTRAERTDESSPLRSGTGWTLGPLLSVHKWFAESNSFTASSSWAETIEARVTRSFNATSSLYLQAGYERFNTTQVDPFSVSGLTSSVGYEARLRLKSTNPDDLMLLGVSLGYEHLFERVNGISGATARTFGGVLGRVRVGYRHNFGPGAALEASLDGGAGKFFLVGSSGSAPVAGLGALQVALIFAL